jgi:hypothetical protein
MSKPNDPAPPGPAKKAKKKAKATLPQQPIYYDEPQDRQKRSPADIAKRNRDQKRAKKTRARPIYPAHRPSYHPFTQYGTGTSAVQTNDRLIARVLGVGAVLALRTPQTKKKVKAPAPKPSTLRDRVVASKEERRRWRRRFFL